MLAPKFAAELDAKWNCQKAKLKLKFSQITDDDLAFDRSKKMEMFMNLQLKLRRTAREIQSIVESL